MKNRVARLHSQQRLLVEHDDVGEHTPTSVLVKMRTGGICGSDLHYFHHGGVGTVTVKEPIILGHELSGIVSGLGSSVTDFKIGDKVAINPSQPCGRCTYCQDDQHQHCSAMRFMGSAKTFPHEQGGFRDYLIVDALQCHKVKDDVDFGAAACAEPLAVCFHALKQAGNLNGKRVLITGAGPIGALCVALASRAGAKDIVVTDVADFVLDIARQMGANRCINVSGTKANWPSEIARDGYFDVAFECSGAEPAVCLAMEQVRPRGTIVQVGMLGEARLPLNLLVNKEISLKGAYRFHSEFDQAVQIINGFEIDFGPLITQTVPLEDVTKAMMLATDRTRAMKVQVQLGS